MPVAILSGSIRALARAGGRRTVTTGTNRGTGAQAPARERGHSYTKDRAQLLRRLSRMEGQVRGIARMVERDEYCIDILQQTSALRAAVDAVSLMIMEDHVAGCLATAVRTGEADIYTEEVMEVVRRSMGRPVRTSRSAGESGGS
jgi:DNA-binding FrmR family transcriptional regulator